MTDVAGIVNITHVAEIVKLTHVARILEAGSMYDLFTVSLMRNKTQYIKNYQLFLLHGKLVGSTLY